MAPVVVVASDTEIEPANAPPFGVIVGLLTSFFESVALSVELAGDRLVTFDIVLADAVTVMELVDVVVFND